MITCVCCFLVPISGHQERKKKIVHDNEKSGEHRNNNNTCVR